MSMVSICLKKPEPLPGVEVVATFVYHLHLHYEKRVPLPRSLDGGWIYQANFINAATHPTY